MLSGGRKTKTLLPNRVPVGNWQDRYEDLLAENQSAYQYTVNSLIQILQVTMHTQHFKNGSALGPVELVTGWMTYSDQEHYTTAISSFHFREETAT